ncbi:hypothetical protein QM565_06045 [Geitlerinema splendidum]|nr:hypothetical protein [Geitlerinema splendidum]
MVRQEVNPEDLAQLAAIFRELGADEPERYANSQLAEGIPQLALFVFLKQAWSAIVDEQDTSWIESYINWGKEERVSKTFWSNLSHSLELMREKGVEDADIATVVQTMQYLLLGSICYQLDDCASSSINAQGEWRVRWKLFQVDDEGKPIEDLGGLHEYADSMDPTGREGGFRNDV